MDGTAWHSQPAERFDPSMIFVYASYALATIMGIGGILALTPWFPFK